MSAAKRTDVGIEERHRKGCATEQRKRCSCGGPSYLASVYDKHAGKRHRKTFSGPGAKTAARQWRQDVQSALRAGTHESQRVVPKTTVREACEQWAKDAERGVITTRSGDPYKPGAIRSYRQSLRLRVLDRVIDMRAKNAQRPRLIPFGDALVHEVRKPHVQMLIDEMNSEGHAPPTVVGAITALRVVLKREHDREHIEGNPVTGVKLPAIRSKRDRIASPQEASALIAALPEDDRALWATAMYTGLRRGELMALRWDAVDLKAGTIEVRQSWDVEHGPQTPKNGKTRRVPIPSVLRDHLLGHKLRQAPGTTLVFGRDHDRPFSPSAVVKRADAAWAMAGLERIGLHECRHTYASLMIAAGVNAKALCDYMGHFSVTVTYDRYGHLMPGAHGEAAAMLDTYLMTTAAQASGDH